MKSEKVAQAWEKRFLKERQKEGPRIDLCTGRPNSSEAGRVASGEWARDESEGVGGMEGSPAGGEGAGELGKEWKTPVERRLGAGRRRRFDGVWTRIGGPVYVGRVWGKSESEGGVEDGSGAGQWVFVFVGCSE
jgi:hypothetical protein